MKFLSFVIGVLAFAGFATAEQPAELTPSQREMLRDVFNAAPGSEIEVEIVTRDGGSIRTSDAGRGTGAGAEAVGDKLNDQFTGSPPSVGRAADGSQSAFGGGADRSATAVAVRVPPSVWRNPLLWLGFLMLAGAGGAVYLRLRRAATILGLAGGAAVASAFFPAFLLLIVAGGLAVVAGPYLWAEFQRARASDAADRNHEALRAVVAGVDDPTVPDAAKAAVKAAIAREADGRDREEIDRVKQADRVGKYAD